MRRTYEEVRQFANELLPEEQVLLASAILESITPEDVITPETEWDAEIARRVAEIKAGTAETCSFHELTQDLRNIVGP
ncbi:MAG TPA: addiction module protein [Terracidiphilus sp.]|nr:addiction module protein [Terracidiphilus sp.]